ncbi:hypothetical protein CK203_112709 [Vitis vinifera]|uniref:Uncharacterized protein n=1 Tax=Vitis vinifera TaxID=29760 RepID=A0A438CD30_VITVI|nr:hypothetical protein CK203_112709 [Vitis vinifera]
MVRTRGAIPALHRDAPRGREPPLLKYPAIPYLRYEMRRPPTTPGATTSRPESSVRRFPAKTARTSGLGESSKASEHLIDSMLPIDLSPESIIRRLMETMRQQPELPDSYDLLQSYQLEHLMNPHGHPSVLEARQIAEALHIPFEPNDLSIFRQWSPVSERDMVHILSRETFTDSVILRKELPLGMLLVDVVLHSNLFPYNIQ